MGKDILLPTLYHREVFQKSNRYLQTRWLECFVNHLDLECELECHGGCVNCLEWNRSGKLLLSGSDDTKICVWDALQQKLLTKISTAHRRNIFTVKFIDKEQSVISGAADAEVERSSIATGQVISTWRCHLSRVKRCCTLVDSEDIAISSSEDCTARQFDLREPHQCHIPRDCRNLLIKNKEPIKSINSNPARSELICVGAADSITRVYDRRMLSLSTVSENITQPLLTFQPGHFRFTQPPSDNRPGFSNSMQMVTWCCFDPTGRQLLSNIGGEHVYLYDLYHPDCVISPETDIKSVLSDHNVPPPPPPPQLLDSYSDSIKVLANEMFYKKDYYGAIRLYSECLQLFPDNIALLNNRSIAYLKRGWKGDNYAALRDAVKATQLDSSHEKGQFRLIQCLEALGLNTLAAKRLDEFQRKFPEGAMSSSVKNLDKKIATSSSSAENNREETVSSSHHDYTHRYLGHFNCQTDIKESNFFGPNQEYILAGSDDTRFFLWDRTTEKLMKVFVGDTHTVNCVQPHPTLPIIATSGLEKVVKLWTPQLLPRKQQEDSTEEYVIDSLEKIFQISQQNQESLANEMNMSTRMFMIEDILSISDEYNNPNACATS